MELAPQPTQAVGVEKPHDGLGAAAGVGVRAQGLPPPGMPERRREPRGMASPALLPRPAPAAPAPSRPTPLPKRPKGRFFVGGTLLLVLSAIGYVVWCSFFRYQAYGVLQGRVIEVAAPSEGVVAELHVREGDAVRQGQLLFTIENLSLRHQAERNHDALRIAQAELSAEIARLQLDTDTQHDKAQKAMAEYYELWATARRESSRLDEYAAELKRAQDLRGRDQGAISAVDLDRRKFEHTGQQAKVEKLQEAVEQMRKRAEIYRTQAPKRLAQLEPIMARLESLQAEAHRLREQIGRTLVCAPVNGTVVTLQRFIGEHARAAETLLKILEDGSVEALLFMPQRSAERLRVGQEVEVVIAPHPQPVACQVLRVAERLEAAPANVERYYRSQEHLVVVHLRPGRGPGGPAALWLGAEVCLPYRWDDVASVVAWWRRTSPLIQAQQTSLGAQP